MSKIRILLAEDHTIVRKGLYSLLQAVEDLEIIGEAADGIEAVRLVKELHPDLVLMDISMPKQNGLEATRKIRQMHSNVKILILSVHSDDEYIYQALRAGARGYIVKEGSVEELVTGIRAVAGGASFLSPVISGKVISSYINRSSRNRTDYSLLTNREKEVLQLIAEGHSNKEIAYILNVRPKTIDTHRTNLMAKLDIHTTAEVTRYAIRHGLINQD